MQVINENKTEKVDVLSILPGECFEAQDMTFLRIVNIEFLHLTDGTTLKSVVGVHVLNGTYFCIPDFGADNFVQRMVTPVFAHVQITDAPKLVN